MGCRGGFILGITKQLLHFTPDKKMLFYLAVAILVFVECADRKTGLLFAEETLPKLIVKEQK